MQNPAKDGPGSHRWVRTTLGTSRKGFPQNKIASQRAKVKLQGYSSE
jgi:hypothetical protein